MPNSRKSRKHGNHKSRDFRQMPLFCKNAVFCHVFLKPKCPFTFFFYVFYNNFDQHKWCDFNTEISTFATAAKVPMLCYLLDQYVTVTSL